MRGVTSRIGESNCCLRALPALGLRCDPSFLCCECLLLQLFVDDFLVEGENQGPVPVGGLGVEFGDEVPELVVWVQEESSLLIVLELVLGLL